MRGGYSKTYVKISVTGWLHGSIRWQLDPAERSVWADLIAWAGQCRMDGLIADNDGRALPREYIANQLNIPQVLLDSTIAKCRHEGRLADNDGDIFLVNFKQYQDEYTRQKPYRDAKKEAEQAAKEDPDKYKKGKYSHLVNR